jgi:hypothetical protein
MRVSGHGACGLQGRGHHLAAPEARFAHHANHRAVVKVAATCEQLLVLGDCQRRQLLNRHVGDWVCYAFHRFVGNRPLLHGHFEQVLQRLVRAMNHALISFELSC